eukprot:gene12277-16465_t
MENFLLESMKHVMSEYSDRLVIHHTLDEMIQSIELWHTKNIELKSKYQLSNSKFLIQRLSTKISNLNKENSQLKIELQNIRTVAVKVRQEFVSEISPLLIDSKNIKKLKNKIFELENRSKRNNLSRDMTNSDDREEIIDRSNSNMQPKNEQSQEDIPSLNNNKITKIKEEMPITSHLIKFNFLFDLEEPLLLQIFSFLNTGEVLAAAQVCRYVYKRVDAIFGIDSTIVKPEWGIRPGSISTEKLLSNNEDNNSNISVTISDQSPSKSNIPAIINTPSNDNNNSTSDIKLSREMITVLTKKLNDSELKVILSIVEKLKKNTTTMNALTLEKEDLSARLQNTESVRDFLVEKLTTAELAIKNLMNEVSGLKRQATSDHEIISYLDLQVQDLERQKVDLINKSTHLQASLDLQVGSHSHSEQLLMYELEEYKQKLEKSESTSKSQKKILVKEVKQLRTQV